MSFVVQFVLNLFDQAMICHFVEAYAAFAETSCRLHLHVVSVALAWVL